MKLKIIFKFRCHHHEKCYSSQKKNQIDLSPFIVFNFITILTSRINRDKNSNVDPYTARCSSNSHIQLNKSSVSLGICQEYKERWKSCNRGAMNTELVDKYVYVIVAATELSRTIFPSTGTSIIYFHPPNQFDTSKRTFNINRFV